MTEREQLGRVARATQEEYRAAQGLPGYRDPWQGLDAQARDFYCRIAERVAAEVRRIDAAKAGPA